MYQQQLEFAVKALKEWLVDKLVGLNVERKEDDYDSMSIMDIQELISIEFLDRAKRIHYDKNIEYLNKPFLHFSNAGLSNPLEGLEYYEKAGHFPAERIEKIPKLKAALERSRILAALMERITRMYRAGPSVKGSPEEVRETEHKMAREFIDLGMAFLRASERGVVDKVQKFIDLGFPVNFQAPDTLETALHRASSTGARQTFDILVNSGKCDYLLKDRKGRLASEKAYLFNGTQEMEDILVKKENEQAEKQGVGFDYFRPQY